MNTLKKMAMAALMATASLSTAVVWAQAAMDMTAGEVKKIDKESQKITIKHAEIKNLEMPGMTMVFRVLDPALLDKVKPGEKVNFTAEKRDGAIIVMAIEVAK
ncbi:MAG: copper-binding protein [Rhodoferax sp.]